ncbi:MAG: tetratricopeptide repeat protein [Actinomycetota bacterium]|nr:tetratricopeptide repeat protein [Actinomycetota bacterium]
MSEQRIKVDAVTDLPFGARLRRLREAAGLTQEELAVRAGLSRNAVGALERGLHKRPYPHTVRSLAHALGLSGEERTALLSVGQKEGSADASHVPAPATESNLPRSSTSLLGREQELAEIRTFLQEARLLTLTGTGGVGKTRLAVEAARDAAGLFPDGTVFVALAPLADSGFVLPTIAQALGLRESDDLTPRQSLHAHLREKRLLLVLDNFEHVLKGAPEVAQLIEACPRLSVLATSRAPLRVRGEQEYPVPPLALPTSTIAPSAEELVGSASGRLFVERAREASPTFELTPYNSGAVAAICWRLAGLPLALELAAAHIRFLDPEALLSRLDQALSAVGARDLPQRQRTMWATLDWSHELLSVKERVLFHRSSVFVGGFSLEAAEAVGAEPGASGSILAEEVLGTLGRLVEQSLVTADRDEKGSGLRYGMLEPVRQYASEQLEESGEAEETKRRHVAHYLAFAEEADLIYGLLTGTRLTGAEGEAWMDRVEREHDNLRTALGWAKERGDAEAGLRLAGALCWFWWMRGYFREGCLWTADFLKKAERGGLEVVDDARAKALLGAGMLSFGYGDLLGSIRFLEEGLATYRGRGNEAGTAATVALLGYVRRGRRDDDRAEELSEEGLRLSRYLGDNRSAAVSLSTLGHIARHRGDPARAARLFGEALAHWKKLEDRRGVAYSLCNLGVAALERGEAGHALEMHEESLRLYEGLQDKAGQAFALINLGDVARSLGDEGRAVSLYEEALVLHTELGNDRGISRVLERLDAQG